MSTAIIDADAHVAIPDELFAERLPASMQAKRPRMLTIDGNHFWLIDGALAPRPTGHGPGTPRGFNTQGLIGAHDFYLDNPTGRLADMDREGVAAQVIYPDLLMVNPAIEDPDVASAVSHVYNDHVAERCASAPSRLTRVAVIALQDPAEATRELRRCIVDLGCVGAVLPPLIGRKLLDHRDFEPFFEEANRLEAAIAIHGVTGVYPLPWADLFDTWFGSRMVAVPLSYMVSMVSLFNGQMLERYPNVRFGFFEAGGCGWVPYWVERLDENIRGRTGKGSTLASEYVRSGRLFFSCEPDEQGLAQVATAVGDGCLLYASDYPHGDSKWPNTVGALRSIPGLPPESQERILSTNAQRFYRGLASREPMR